MTWNFEWQLNLTRETKNFDDDVMLQNCDVSSNINEVIKTVENLLLFFTKRFYTHKKAPKSTKKHQKAQKTPKNTKEHKNATKQKHKTQKSEQK